MADRPTNSNLIPLSARTPEEVREMARNGGRKSGKVRNARKTFRESLKLLLSGKVEKQSPLYKKAKAMMKMLGLSGDPCGQTLIDLGVFQKAMKGDTFAATFIRDTVGEKPVETFEDVTPQAPIVLGVIPEDKVETVKREHYERNNKED